eukprot:5242596-Pleurochrysis_carterae.AAC.1
MPRMSARCGEGRRREARLDERINVSDGGDVIWDEGLHLGLELDVVRLVPGNVLEELADILRNEQRNRKVVGGVRNISSLSEVEIKQTKATGGRKCAGKRMLKCAGHE